MNRQTVSVIGSGAWGTSLADILAKNGHAVRQWSYEPEVAAAINHTHENAPFLPGIRLHPDLSATTDLAQAVAGADLIVVAVPCPFLRALLPQLRPALAPEVPIVSATKGIENGTLQLPTQIIAEALADCRPRLAALSGPSFAREVALGQPTAVVLATPDAPLAGRLQPWLTSPTFRVYTSVDIIGVQLGGALKNVMGVAAGIADGLGFGHNTRAALIARGLSEIARLGRALGADARTFSGLSGLGDLVLTCTGDLSRNRNVGLRIGRGEALAAILQSTRTVAEGVETARAVIELAQRRGVRMPICAAVHAVLFRGQDARQAVLELLQSHPADEGGIP